MIGKVTKWFPKRGYGFVKGTDGKDYFVHWKQIHTKEKWKYLTEGEAVTFHQADRDGNNAADVRLLREYRQV